MNLQELYHQKDKKHWVTMCTLHSHPSGWPHTIHQTLKCKLLFLSSISIFGGGSTEIYDNEYIPRTVNHINSEELISTLFVPTIENNKVKNLNYKDTVKIPKVIFNITHLYKELIGNKFLNDGFQDYYIIQAIQDVVFRFDEKGVFLKSSATIEVEKSIEDDIIFVTVFVIFKRRKMENTV